MGIPEFMPYPARNLNRRTPDESIDFEPLVSVAERCIDDLVKLRRRLNSHHHLTVDETRGRAGHLKLIPFAQVGFHSGKGSFRIHAGGKLQAIEASVLAELKQLIAHVGDINFRLVGKDGTAIADKR